MAFYPTNNKVYVINKVIGQIVAFQASNSGLEKPTVWIADERLKLQSDITIDGDVYTYGENGILKFTSGKPVEFAVPKLFTPLSGSGKILTDKSLKNLYILDIGTNRVIILSKTGELIQSLASPEITNMLDFSVDEKNKTIYLLTKDKLWQINF